MPAPALGGLSDPIVVQLVTRDAPLCFESTFGGTEVSANTPERLKARHAE